MLNKRIPHQWQTLVRKKKNYLLKNTHSFRGSMKQTSRSQVSRLRYEALPLTEFCYTLKMHVIQIDLCKWRLKVERTVNRKSASIIFTGVVILHGTKFLFSFLSKGAGIFFTYIPGFNGMNCNYIDIPGNLRLALNGKEHFAYPATHISTYGTPASEVMKKYILL